MFFTSMFSSVRFYLYLFLVSFLCLGLHLFSGLVFQPSCGAANVQDMNQKFLFNYCYITQVNHFMPRLPFQINLFFFSKSFISLCCLLLIELILPVHFKKNWLVLLNVISQYYNAEHLKHFSYFCDFLQNFIR